MYRIQIKKNLLPVRYTIFPEWVKEWWNKPFPFPPKPQPQPQPQPHPQPQPQPQPL